LTSSADRLHLEERRDKPDHAQYQEDPQKYNGKDGDSSDYRKESFHHAAGAAAKRLSISRVTAGMSPGCLLVTRLPCTTTSRPTQVAPAFRGLSGMGMVILP
jgi:hypothetical protein